LKQWLAMLTRNYPEATELFTVLRRETEPDQVSRLLGLPVAEAA
jgi:tRNA-dihydrouridine synthase C